MSYDGSIDPELIEQTKRQIQSLVAEIAQLTKQTQTPGEFYGEFLNRLIAALAAIGGAIWTLGDNGQLSLQYQVNLQQTGLLTDEEKQNSHGRLLYKALANESVTRGEGILVPPHSGFGDDDQAANATEFLLVIGPLKTDLEMVGLVEVFQRAEAASNVQQGYLRFLLQMCDLAGEFLKSHQLRHFSDRQVLWARLEDFTRTVHTSLEPKATAYTIANEGRRLIECDRVSVALRKGRHCTIEAVSGQDVFDKRSNTVRLLGRLASAVVATGEPIWYTGDTRDMAPQVEEAVQEYVDEAHSKMIAVLPLGRPKPDQETDAEDREKGEASIGALIVEQIEDNRIAPSLSQRVDVVCQHSSSAMANAMEHQNLFLMPVWRAIGKSTFLVKARTLPKTISISLAVVAVIVLLIVWPANFDLNGKGTIEPVDHREVFARVDGIVDELGLDADGHKIQHGSLVHKGQLLMRMENSELGLQRADIDGKVKAKREHLFSTQRLLSNGGLRPEDRTRLQGDMAESEQEIASLEAQSNLYDEKIKDLEVRSPIDGIVVTWELETHLLKKPVQRGQVLVRVDNPQGDWELEVHMPEDRMGHIMRAETESLAKQNKHLLVPYILATEPGVKLYGTIKEIEKTAEIRGEEGNTVTIRVAIDKNDVDPANLRPGAAVNAKVRCGRRPLGYVWFHDILAFVEKTLFRI